MRHLATVLIFAVATAMPALPATPEQDVIKTVQKLFDAMEARDESAIKAVLVGDAKIASIRANQTLSNSTGADFATRIAAAKEPLLERMWQPKVMIEGGIATLWAPYDFHRAGKLTHCGVDSVTLFQTADGWKISGVFFNVVEGAKCSPSPLGPPAAK
ncbi:MAG: hypothetical protein NTZ56_15290 [Acidobacteria bacterium]|nr:hypothetical protein [Acidobacteriota bacterium]